MTVKILLSISQHDNGTWECEFGGQTFYAPSPADAILEALESTGFDRMNTHIKKLRARNDELEAKDQLLEIDHTGLEAFVEELKKQVDATMQCAGDDRAMKERLTHLRKLTAPWPPRRSFLLN